MENEKKKSKKVLLIVLISVLVLVLALLVTGFIFGKSLLGYVGRLDGEEETISLEEEEEILNETDPTEPGATEEQVEIEEEKEDAQLINKSDNIINILLVGQDKRENQKRQRSDSMILVTINRQKKSLTMTSFMRDLWVRIPGKYDERLNVPYKIGGFKMLNATLESEFGIKVDHNVEVDFTSFEKIVDALGGVEITLSKGEAKQVSNVGDKIEAGTHVLNGTQALAYARIRKIDNDFARTNRQRKVISAILSKVKNVNLTELYDLAKTILPMIRTDMTDSEIMGYILEFAPQLSQMEVVSQRIPIDKGYVMTRIKGKSVLYLNKKNRQKNLDFLRETLGE